MPLRRLTVVAALFLVLASHAGCATSSAVASGDTLDVQLQIDNNLRDITGVSIYLMTDAGSRRSLGPLESNQRRSYDRTLRAGDYQLIATRVGQSDIVSERFRIDTDNVVVVWSLAQNQLTFGQR